MIEETATVTRCDGEFVWLEAARRSTCSTCSVNKGCGSGLLATLFGRKVARIKALNTIDATVGETVVVGMREAAMLQASLMVYLMPLLVMLVFALLGEMLARQLDLASTEVLTIIAGLAGLLLAAILLSRFNRKVGRDGRYQPVLLRKLGAAHPVHHSV